MKKSDYFKIASLKLFKRKFFILFLTIISLLLLGILTFRTNFTNFLNDAIVKNVGFRTLSVSPNYQYSDYGFETLTNLEYVVDVHSAKYDFVSLESSYKTEYLDGHLELKYGNQNIFPKNIIGDTFESDESGFAICPIDFYPSSKAFVYDIDEKYMLDGYELLNTTFDITYYSYKLENGKLIEDIKHTKTFEIIGLYNNKIAMNSNNTCYISEKDLSQITKETNSTHGDVEAVWGFMVVLDDVQHVDDVLLQLENLGFYETTVQRQLDISLINMIITSCNILVSVIIVASVFLTINFIKKKDIIDRKNIGVLRSCGYNQNEINIIMFLEIFLLDLISYTFGFVLFYILFKILKSTLFLPIMYSGFEIKVSFINIIFTFIIIVFSGLIFQFILHNKNRKKDINIIGLINGE